MNTLMTVLFAYKTPTKWDFTICQTNIFVKKNRFPRFIFHQFKSVLLILNPYLVCLGFILTTNGSIEFINPVLSNTM